MPPQSRTVVALGLKDTRIELRPINFNATNASDSGYGGSLGNGHSQSSASVVDLREKRLQNRHTISEDYSDDKVVRKRQLMALHKALCGGISKTANRSVGWCESLAISAAH
jgi:hypothetical protein